MNYDPQKQWVGAVYAEDLDLMRSMLKEDPSLAHFSHEAFDDPFRSGRFSVATLAFAVVGSPQQQIDWRSVEAGADPNVDNLHGRPLCLCREEHIAQYLIDKGGDINLWHDNGGAAIYFSVWQIDPDRLKKQLRPGADARQINPHNGSSTLHSATEVAPNHDVLADHLETIRTLQNVEGETPLDVARRELRDRAVTRLLEIQ